MEGIEILEANSNQDTIHIDIAGLSGCILYNEDGMEVFSFSSGKEQHMVVRDCQEEPYLNMYFSLEGTSSARPLYTDREYSLKTNRHIVGYTPYFEGEYSLKGNRVENFGISMKESYFKRLIATDLPCLQRFWDNVHAGIETDISDIPMPITGRQRAVIREILNCQYIGQMRKLYMESKATELFFLQAQQADNLPVEHNYLHLKQSDKESLYAAKAFVQQCIFEPLTLKSIAREVGLNEFKLKKGFKQLFGCTVFDYLMQCRMEYACKLLLDTKHTIGEVAYILGYSDPYNFSKAFRKYFGHLPSQL